MKNIVTIKSSLSVADKHELGEIQRDIPIAIGGGGAFEVT